MLRYPPTDRTSPSCNPNDERLVEQIPKERSNSNAFDLEYAVAFIVRHVGKGNKTKYAVFLYEYTPAKDTIDPAEDIPQHFITSHWNRVEKPSKP